MCEAFIDQIAVTADDTVRPTFRLPLASNDEGPALEGASPADVPVPKLPTLVGDTGFESSSLERLFRVWMTLHSPNVRFVRSTFGHFVHQARGGAPKVHAMIIDVWPDVAYFGSVTKRRPRTAVAPPISDLRCAGRDDQASTHSACAIGRQDDAVPAENVIRAVSGGVFVLVENTAEAATSADVEMSQAIRVGDWFGQRCEWSNIGDALVRSVRVVVRLELA
jgi:hypothetical protein